MRPVLKPVGTPVLGMACDRNVRGCTCAYVSLDATGAQQQRENVASAEVKIAYVGMI